MSVGVGRPFLPPPPLFSGRGVGGIAWFLACERVCVSSDGGRDCAYRRRGTKSPNTVETHLKPVYAVKPKIWSLKSHPPSSSPSPVFLSGWDDMAAAAPLNGPPQKKR